MSSFKIVWKSSEWWLSNVNFFKVCHNKMNSILYWSIQSRSRVQHWVQQLFLIWRVNSFNREVIGPGPGQWTSMLITFVTESDTLDPEFFLWKSVYPIRHIFYINLMSKSNDDTLLSVFNAVIITSHGYELDISQY